MRTVLQEPLPFRSVDDDTASLLALVAGDPLHARDREHIVQTIVDVAREHDGQVDPNLVRAALGQQVYPRVTGAVYGALRRVGVLQVDGWTISDDLHGRNSGRPQRLYRLVIAPAVSG